MADFPEEKLWERPAGVASPGFHLQHLSGVLSRLFTYARGESLTPAQRDGACGRGRGASTRRRHGEHSSRPSGSRSTRDRRVARDRRAHAHGAREVGRGKLPSTRLGLMVHAAEHTQRHVGQLLVTVRVLQANEI